MDSDGNETTSLLEHVQNEVYALVDGLTTDDTINDDQRVEILLEEITSITESPDVEGYAYRVFEFISNAFATRGNNDSCPDVELDRTILMIRNTMERYPYPVDTGIISLGRLVRALHTRFKKSKNMDDIDESISLTLYICNLDPSRGVSFSNLGTELIDKFQVEPRDDDLLEAITALKKARELIPESASYRMQSLRNLGISLKLAYNKFSRPEYLEEAIELQRHFVEYHIQSDSGDLLHETREGRENPLTSLSSLLRSRFEFYSNKGDLDEAIDIAVAALQAIPLENSDSRCGALEQLALCLHSKLERDGNIDDANAVIEIHRELLEHRLSMNDESLLPECFSNIGAAHNERYKITGDKRSLDEAIAILREAERITPDSNKMRSYVLHNLANSLRERYHTTGADSDLEESILLLRKALHLRPVGHELRSSTLHSLSTSLKVKYEDSSSSLFSEAQSSFWEGIDEYILGHKPWTPNVLDLGAKFDEIFQASKEKEYLDEAIKCLEEALTLSSSPSARVKVLHSLGNSLRSRSGGKFVEQQYFLRNYLSMKMKAVENPGNILNLAHHQLEKLQEFGTMSSFGNLEDINLAMSYFKQVVDLGNFDVQRSYSLMAFADCLSTKFHYVGDVADLQEAIGIYRSLLLSVPKDSREINFSPRNLTNFAQLLMKTFIATKEDVYLEEAVAQYRAATNIRSNSFPLERQQMARIWAKAVNGYHESALEAYKIAIELLPRIAAMSMNIDFRRKALQEADAESLCHDGTGCALQLGRYQDAVEFLEHGRAIYWSQVLQLRSPLEELSDKAPELADRLQHISDQLHFGSLRDSLPNDFQDSQQRQSFESDVAYYQDLENEWEKLLAEVRGLQGFEGFLLPKEFSVLQEALGTDETVVLLSGAGGFDTSSALLISHDEIQHVPLFGIDAGILSYVLSLIKAGKNSQKHIRNSSSDNALECPPAKISTEKVQEFKNKYRHGRVKSHENNETDDASLYRALHWIWDGISKPILKALCIEKIDDPPRIWWCPTGLFSFLPLHAAGIHKASCYLPDEPPECVSDYLTSSYIPTLGSFLSRRGANSLGPEVHSTAEFKMMVILEPRTLPWTVEELKRIRRHVPSEQLTILGDTPSNRASVEGVVSCLPTSSIVHFSCHGIQNIVNPLETALLMDDGPLTIRRIMQQPMPRSYLAFLCACETATGTEELADEAMSFGSSLLYSGFQSVVGTMWSIADEDGANIADKFYGFLFDQQNSRRGRISLTDGNQSARALHSAVKGLRERGVPLERWVPFIHMGM